MGARQVTVIALTVSLLLLSGCAGGGCGTPVPDVKGKTPAQAEEALRAAGFKSGKITYDAEAEGAAGAVVAQDPGAGTPSRAGAIVNLTVAGAAPVTVPSVVGMPRDAATTALAEEALFLRAASESYSATAAAGVVMAQNPAPGTEVPHESTVEVVVSLGPQASAPTKASPAPTKVKVPAVKGLKLAVAKSKIEADGLTWDHQLGEGDGMTDVGFVYKQVPAAGTLVDVGSVVTLLTWEGP